MKSSHGTLTLTVVSTVNLSQTNANSVAVHFRSGTGPIYFTVDGSTPTVGGADTYVVHANLPVRSVPLPTTDTQQIKLISASSDDYSVEAEA